MDESKNSAPLTDTFHLSKKADSDSLQENPCQQESNDSLRTSPPQSDEPQAVSPTAKESEPEEEEKEASKEVELMVKVQELAGSVIKSQQLISRLEQAYRSKNIDPQTIVWIHQTKNGLIPVESPQQAGLQMVPHPWLGLIYQGIAKLLVPTMHLKIKSDTAIFPNGSSFSLKPLSWVDSTGKRADLYQVTKLPDGTWFRLTSMQSEEMIPLSAGKILRNIVETRINKLEQSGMQRETPSSVPAVALSSKPTGDYNPFLAAGTHFNASLPKKQGFMQKPPLKPPESSSDILDFQPPAAEDN